MEEVSQYEFQKACQKVGGQYEARRVQHKDEHGMVYQTSEDIVCNLGPRGELELIDEAAPSDYTVTGEIEGERVTVFGVDNKYRDLELSEDGRLIFPDKGIVV